MKKLIVLVIAIAIIAMTGVAMADTANVTVSANVVGTCKFNAAATLPFGALDQTVSSDASASTSTTFWCTKNSTYNITDNGGLHNSGGPRMENATTAGEFIPYSFTYTPTTGPGTGKTLPITLTINGSITNANYINAAAGNYADTVILTIAP